jgi:hypothetical protein
MPFRCEEDGACDFGDTKIGKRPRTFAGTEAANLGGTGFPPAGLLGVSSRRLRDDSSSGEAFLTVQDTSEDFRQGLQRGLTPKDLRNAAARDARQEARALAAPGARKRAVSDRPMDHLAGAAAAGVESTREQARRRIFHPFEQQIRVERLRLCDDGLTSQSRHWRSAKTCSPMAQKRTFDYRYLRSATCRR